jgi:hypothetical protein
VALNTSRVHKAHFWEELVEYLCIGGLSLFYVVLFVFIKEAHCYEMQLRKFIVTLCSFESSLLCFAVLTSRLHDGLLSGGRGARGQV